MEYYGNNDWRDYIRRHNELRHFGIPKRSGRYPWGSGEDPYHHGADAPGGKKKSRPGLIDKLKGRKESQRKDAEDKEKEEREKANKYTRADIIDEATKLKEAAKNGLYEDYEKYEKYIKDNKDVFKNVAGFTPGIPQMDFEGKNVVSSDYDNYDKYIDDYVNRFIGYPDDFREREKADISKSDVDFDETEIKTLENIFRKAETKELSSSDKEKIDNLLIELNDWEADGLSKRDFYLKQKALAALDKDSHKR